MARSLYWGARSFLDELGIYYQKIFQSDPISDSPIRTIRELKESIISLNTIVIL